MTVADRAQRPGWGVLVDGVLRRFAAVTLAGALLGLLVGGVGGRLAMMLLAGLNPDAAGIRSDDGFVIGRFTAAGTVQLLLITTMIGVLGGGVYLGLRALMFGPRWWQLTSITAGAAVVVGSMLVDPYGVDFVVLQPAALAIAIFVAIPGVFAALLTLLAERWLRPGGWFLRSRRAFALAPLLLWVPLIFVIGLWVLGWLLMESVRGLFRLRPPWLRSAAMWAARLAVTALFLVSLVALVRDTTELT